MKDRIRISDVGSYYLQNVKRRLNLFAQPNYVPMRIAFGRSLMSEKEPVISSVPDEIKQKAKELRGNEQPALTIFEQNQRLYFQILLSQRYKKKVEEVFLLLLFEILPIFNYIILFINFLLFIFDS